MSSLVAGNGPPGSLSARLSLGTGNNRENAGVERTVIVAQEIKILAIDGQHVGVVDEEVSAVGLADSS